MHRPRWFDLFRRAGGKSGAEALLEDLEDRYAEPPRHYHALSHLNDCFTVFDRFNSGTRGLIDKNAIEMALWYHDVFYVPQAVNNEELSAEYARLVLGSSGFNAVFIDRVAQHVLATKTHQHGGDPDTAFLLDVDLSILGAPEAAFDEYERRIRREYHFAPEPIYIERRKKVMATFLARDRLFFHSRIHAALDTQARTNLRRSIARLEQGIILV